MIEARYGVLEAFCEETDPTLLTQGLGRVFEFERVCFKRYPCHVTAHVPVQLLRGTLIVRDLATARAIAASGAGHRFVTLQGELLEPDGTLTVGTNHAEMGILSRKSELRELRERVAALDGRIAAADRRA